MKKRIIFILGIILVIVLISLIFKFYKNNSINDELLHKEGSLEYLELLTSQRNELINDRDVAIEYGELIYRKYFPEHYKKNKNKIEIDAFYMDTDEYGEVWKVYTTTKSSSWNIFNKYAEFGGSTEILFKKSGEIMGFSFGM